MINNFLQYLQYEKNYSSHTVLSYHVDLSQFCEFLQIEPDKFDPSQVTPTVIQQWVLNLITLKDSPRTISRKISTLKSLWHYLLMRHLADKNPTLKIVLPKTKKTLPAFYKQKEMNQALHSYEGLNGFKDVRDAMILRLFYETGIRVSELTGIADKDVSFSSKELRVIGKRNKQRIIPLGNDICKQLKKYISVRDEDMERLTDKLFIRENGLEMYSRGVYNVVHNKMSQAATLHKQSPHVLRHTFATTLLNNGADINAVKDLLGHSSLAATQVYTHVNFSELKDIYRNTHPREKNKKGGIYET